VTRILDRLTVERGLPQLLRTDNGLENSGVTWTEAAFDVDGAIYTLKSYAKAGAALGEARVKASTAVSVAVGSS